MAKSELLIVPSLLEIIESHSQIALPDDSSERLSALSAAELRHELVGQLIWNGLVNGLELREKDFDELVVEHADQRRFAASKDMDVILAAEQFEDETEMLEPDFNKGEYSDANPPTQIDLIIAMSYLAEAIVLLANQNRRAIDAQSVNETLGIIYELRYAMGGGASMKLSRAEELMESLNQGVEKLAQECGVDASVFAKHMTLINTYAEKGFKASAAMALLAV